MKPQRLKAYRAEQQQHKADAVRIGRQIVVQRIAARHAVQFAKAAHHRDRQPNTSKYADSPKSSNAMSATHARAAADVLDTSSARGVRERRIVWLKLASIANNATATTAPTIHPASASN